MAYIALIGHNTLESKALHDICAESIPCGHTHCTALSFASLREMEISGRRFDGYIVQPEIYLMHASYFMPRRHQTLIISHHRDVTCSEEYPMIISAYADADTITAALQRILPTRDEAAGTTETALSAREREVLAAVASGLTSKEVAEKLNISFNTVLTHRKNISSKLGIRSASGLSLYAVLNGIV